MNIDKVETLNIVSLFKLIIFNILTLGIYGGQYIKLLSEKLNQLDDIKHPINLHLCLTIVTLIYVNALFSISTVFYSGSELFHAASSLVSLITWVAVLVWALKVRDILNSTLLLKKGDENWFSLAWTVIFNYLYFNHKIELICRGPSRDSVENT
ncbi:DUF4234 domain-containing protein [Vibrio mexicanus]|uniref:DUF4234 domain-containing protein n=1 Tax=Vibrio mexicanus TaxID=1004326 RepID=UPI00063CE701